MTCKKLELKLNVDFVFTTSLLNLCKEEQKKIAWELYKEAGGTADEILQRERLDTYSDYIDLITLLEEAEEKFLTPEN